VTTLLDPIALRGRVAPTRVLFGPHVTNLARRHVFTPAHAAYYAARARGGAGIIVLEQVSVHPSDQPYELALHAWVDGFEAHLRPVGEAVREAGGLAVLALGHTGGQATGTLSQQPVLAPSRMQEVATREMAKEIEPAEIAEVIAAFASAAASARRAGLDGVEIGAGQHSLVRQFLSGLTNQRSDEFGGDEERRLAFARAVVAAVRAAVGPDGIVGLRLSVDEFAPWAGITPDAGVAIAARLCEGGAIDYLVVTRGGPYSVNRTQPGAFIAEPRDESLVRRVRESLPASVAVFAQGGIADPADAAAIVESAVADGVEMTRALIADPDLPARVGAGTPDEIRPCLLCNEDCQVRDIANHVVSCIHNPRAGHETDAEFGGDVPPGRRRRVLVVGAGPAGLEAAMVAASLGHEVAIWEVAGEPGGAVRSFAAAPTRERYARAVEWRVAMLRRAGVPIETGRRATLDDLVASGADHIILATGGRARQPRIETGALGDEGRVFSARDVLATPMPGPLAAALTSGDPLVVFDLEWGFAGTTAAEILAAGSTGPVWLVTTANFVGIAELPPGGLPGLRARLHASGVRTLAQQQLARANGRTLVFRHAHGPAEVEIGDVAALVVCEHDVPDDDLFHAAASAGLPVERVGDAVAPRRILDAVLEGGRAARRLGRVPSGAGIATVEALPAGVTRR
jgi:2,4-dienoyl-CoA reductase-like NADH-dependent reductase (Old Yellow Enzyme family)